MSLNLNADVLKKHAINTESAIACRINKSGESLIYVSELATTEDVMKALIQFSVEREKIINEEKVRT